MIYDRAAAAIVFLSVVLCSQAQGGPLEFSTDVTINLGGYRSDLSRLLDQLQKERLVPNSIGVWSFYVPSKDAEADKLVKRQCPTCTELPPLPVPVSPCVGASPPTPTSRPEQGFREYRFLGTAEDFHRMVLGNVGDATEPRRDQPKLIVKVPVNPHPINDPSLGKTGGYLASQRSGSLEKLTQRIRELCPECTDVDPEPKPVPVVPPCR